MTPLDPAQIPWLVPWWPVRPEQAAGMVAELRRELCPQHVLFGRRAQTVGSRQDCDDVLFYLGETTPRFAVVHLTYRQSRETNPIWPGTTLFDTLEAWIDQCLIPDAEDFAWGNPELPAQELIGILDAAFPLAKQAADSPSRHAEMISQLQQFYSGMTLEDIKYVYVRAAALVKACYETANECREGRMTEVQAIDLFRSRFPGFSSATYESALAWGYFLSR